ncbi:MAG TPA: tail fiber domain-containing protein [Candidatus Acidoferrales bacterium]|nr:tail fiber domain-containing protein [Candidatus Acidoferrales bacterium]
MNFKLTQALTKRATLLLLFATSSLETSTVFAQGTAFTYQGQLQNNGSPANGNYDLQFIVYNAGTGGSQVGPILTNAATIVSNGLFTVVLDFGAGIFGGSDHWLDISVRTNGTSTFDELTPRQQLTPTPYAIYAEGANAAGLSGIVPMSSLSGTYGTAVSLTNGDNSFSGNGSGLTGVNATTLNGLGANNFWRITGNAGTTAGVNFLGTLDNQPLELWVNQSRAFRLEPGTNGIPNVIGGAPNNAVGPGVVGATIAGGGAVNQTVSSFLPGPSSNYVSAIFGTIGGGRLNNVGADHATIAGGFDNTIQALAYDSAIGGGYSQFISSNCTGAVIAGGHNNSVNGYFGTVGGGVLNTSGGNGAVVGGGGYDGTTYSGNVAGGGASVVGGGVANNAADLWSAIGGGCSNTVSGVGSTVGGGAFNTASEYADTVGGGAYNTASSPDGSATVGGGYDNTASGDSATVGGGFNNEASGDYSMVLGGGGNTAAGDYSFAAGTSAQALHQGAFVWADSQLANFSSTANDQFSVRAQGGVVLAADVTLSGGAAYHNLSLSGGNAVGYLYGSYPALGDGVHLGYNWYYDASGTGHVANSGGATSRLTVGYGFVGMYVGGVDAAPSTERLYADSTGVTVMGTFNNSSDRNAKQDFAPVSASDILDKVLRLPVSEWSYKTDATTRHIGPMGQDFYATFNVGTDEKHIAPIDEGGVALAAIQGLNQKLEEKDMAMQQLKQQNDSLVNRLNELEQLVQSLAQKK